MRLKVAERGAKIPARGFTFAEPREVLLPPIQ